MAYNRNEEGISTSYSDTDSDSESDYECSTLDELDEAVDEDSDEEIYSDIVQELNLEFIQNSINKSQLLGHFSFEDNIASLKNEKFNLLYRRSKREIIVETVSKIKEAQTTFAQKLDEASEFFKSNICSAFMMDRAFGDVEDDLLCNKSLNPVVRQQTDGSLQLNCPMKGCAVNTHRLKRHLRLKHSHLNENKVEFCIVMARRMEKNKLTSEECTVTEKPNLTKTKKHRPLEHASKKHNYVKCNLCKFLATNISQHLQTKHKLATGSEIYVSSLKQSEVIPKVYTKSDGKGVVELSGSELSAAQDKYGEKIEEERSVLLELKKGRQEMEKLKMMIQEATSQTERTKLCKKLQKTTQDFKKYRYRDTRTYSENTKVWKDSFESYLKLRDNFNPKRCASMAIDIVLKYEEANGSLSFSDLSNTKNIRKMVHLFKNSEGMKSSSKIKYLKMFSNFLRFLLLDCDSPEKSTDEGLPDKLSKSVLFDEASHEVDNVIVSLSKRTGMEILERREETEKKLISKAELIDISSAVRNKLLKILTVSTLNRSRYSCADAITVRNDLIAIATINLGRRSMEITTTMSEAKKTVLQTGETYFVVQVLEQKGMKSGKKAAVTFREDEFEVLKVFIHELRSKICTNDKLKCVFPSSGEGGRQMSLSGIWKILTKYKTKNGTKLTSRLIRKSKVTNSRTLDLTEGEKDATAHAMGHNTSTSERYYNHRSLISSTNACLSLEMSRSSVERSSHGTPSLPGPSSSSTPIMSFTLSKTDSQVSSSILSTERESVKRKVTFEESSDSSYEPDITIKNLRTKKLKSGNKVAEEELERYVEGVVKSCQETGTTDKLYSAKGLISVKYVSENLPTSARKQFSVKKIRRVVEKYL